MQGVTAVLLEMRLKNIVEELQLHSRVCQVCSELSTRGQWHRLARLGR